MSGGSVDTLQLSNVILYNVTWHEKIGLVFPVYEAALHRESHGAYRFLKP